MYYKKICTVLIFLPDSSFHNNGSIRFLTCSVLVIHLKFRCYPAWIKGGEVWPLVTNYRTCLLLLLQTFWASRYSYTVLSLNSEHSVCVCVCVYLWSFKMVYDSFLLFYLLPLDYSASSVYLLSFLNVFN